MTAMPVITFLFFDALRPVSSAVREAVFAPIPRSLLPLLVEGWFAGVVVLAARFAGGFLLLERKRRLQSSAPAAAVLALAHAVQQRLGVERAIRYLECGWLQVPAIATTSDWLMASISSGQRPTPWSARRTPPWLRCFCRWRARRLHRYDGIAPTARDSSFHCRVPVATKRTIEKTEESAMHDFRSASVLLLAWRLAGCSPNQDLATASDGKRVQGRWDQPGPGDRGRQDGRRPDRFLQAHGHDLRVGQDGRWRLERQALGPLDVRDGQLVDDSAQTVAASGPAVTEFHVSKPDGWPAGSDRSRSR